MAKKPTYTSRPTRGEATQRFKGSGLSARMHPSDAKISDAISERDRKDVKAVEKKQQNPFKRSWVASDTPTKMEVMAANDAKKRLNRMGFIEMSEKVSCQGYTLKEGQETRDRLKKVYGAMEKEIGRAHV